jgi:DnaK suppressor protein
MNHLSQKFLDQIESALEQRFRQLTDEVRASRVQGAGQHFSDLISGAADRGDEAVATEIVDLGAAEVYRDQQELLDIRAARERIAEGSYGICPDCGTEINVSRLLAYPAAKYCLSCQERKEKSEDRRISSL